MHCQDLVCRALLKLSLHSLNSPDCAHGCGCICKCTGRPSVAVQVAIALKGAVYLWNASTGSIETVRPPPMHALMLCDEAWC